jgi:hypothetical protein
MLNKRISGNNTIGAYGHTKVVKLLGACIETKDKNSNYAEKKGAYDVFMLPDIKVEVKTRQVGNTKEENLVNDNVEDLDPNTILKDPTLLTVDTIESYKISIRDLHLIHFHVIVVLLVYQDARHYYVLNREELRPMLKKAARYEGNYEGFNMSNHTLHTFYKPFLVEEAEQPGNLERAVRASKERLEVIAPQPRRHFIGNHESPQP